MIHYLLSSVQPFLSRLADRERLLKRIFRFSLLVPPCWPGIDLSTIMRIKHINFNINNIINNNPVLTYRKATNGNHIYKIFFYTTMALITSIFVSLYTMAKYTIIYVLMCVIHSPYLYIILIVFFIIYPMLFIFIYHLFYITEDTNIFALTPSHSYTEAFLLICINILLLSTLWPIILHILCTFIQLISASVSSSLHFHPVCVFIISYIYWSIYSYLFMALWFSIWLLHIYYWYSSFIYSWSALASSSLLSSFYASSSCAPPWFLALSCHTPASHLLRSLSIYMDYIYSYSYRSAVLSVYVTSFYSFASIQTIAFILFIYYSYALTASTFLLLLLSSRLPLYCSDWSSL